MDSISSPSNGDNKQTDHSADIKDEEDANIHEDSSQGNPSQSLSMSEQDHRDCDAHQDQHVEEEDSEIDCDSSVNNRFTVLSDEPNTKDSISDCDKTSDVDQGENDAHLADEMEQVTLDDAFIEDSDAEEQVGESEDEPLEAKDYTVVNQDPELAFCTLATRTVPDKQECSVESCLFQFTEMETLTQNNSLLCVTCTKQQTNNGTGYFALSHIDMFCC